MNRKDSWLSALINNDSEDAIRDEAVRRLIGMTCEVGHYNPDGTETHPHDPGRCREQVHTVVPVPGGSGLIVCEKHADASERKP